MLTFYEQDSKPLHPTGIVPILAAILFLSTFALPTQAAISFTNGSFETVVNNRTGGGPFAIGLDNNSSVTGWTLNGNPAGTATNKQLNCLMNATATNNLCGGAYSNAAANGNGAFQFWNAAGTGGGKWLGGASPNGGNFLGFDADTQFSLALQQSVSGMTTGNIYRITFYQAAGQQYNRTGNMTQKWNVSLGSQTLSSTQMAPLSKQYTGWNQQSLMFTYTGLSTTAILQFAAEGTPSGGPPFILLDGVTMTDMGTPEPGSLFLLGSGLLALFATKQKRPLP